MAKRRDDTPRDPPRPTKPAQGDVPRLNADDAAAWFSAMTGVRPIDGAPSLPLPKKRKAPKPPTEPVISREDYARQVAGSDAFDMEMEGDTIRGRAADVSRVILARLASGEMPIEARLDLHGFTRAEAEPLVLARIAGFQQAGARVVLVITGRGKGSEGGGVLRTSLVSWLTRPPLVRLVLAFSNARPKHGGAGAVYVLLRKQRA